MVEFFLLIRFIPSRKTIIHTADPVRIFMIRISVSVIPSKDTSIERCNEKIDTEAVAKDMFLKVRVFSDGQRLDFISLTVAKVIFIKA